VVVFKLEGCAGDAFCHINAYSRHVNLGFYRGAALPDPHRVLKGAGKKFRHIRFDSPEDLAHEYLRTYIRAAIEHAFCGAGPRPARLRP
jgi:hypothetical protein